MRPLPGPAASPAGATPRIATHRPPRACAPADRFLHMAL